MTLHPLQQGGHRADGLQRRPEAGTIDQGGLTRLGPCWWGGAGLFGKETIPAQGQGHLTGQDDGVIVEGTQQAVGQRHLDGGRRSLGRHRASSIGEVTGGGPHQTLQHGVRLGARGSQSLGHFLRAHGHDGHRCQPGWVSGQVSGDDLNDVQVAGILQDENHVEQIGDAVRDIGTNRAGLGRPSLADGVSQFSQREVSQCCQGGQQAQSPPIKAGNGGIDGGVGASPRRDLSEVAWSGIRQVGAQGQKPREPLGVQTPNRGGKGRRFINRTHRRGLGSRGVS